MASVAHCRSDKAATSARPISCRSVSACPGRTVKRRIAPPSCCLSARLERGRTIARGDESGCAQDQDDRGKASIARGSAELISGSRPGRRGKVGLWVASLASCGSFQRVAGVAYVLMVMHAQALPSRSRTSEGRHQLQVFVILLVMLLFLWYSFTDPLSPSGTSILLDCAPVRAASVVVGRSIAECTVVRVDRVVESWPIP